MNKPIIINRPGASASQKIERVTSKLGMKALNKQQGTHRVIFDSLPLIISAELQTLRFFKNVQTRQFPFANINQNKLDAGESMAIERAFLFLIRNQSAILPNDVVNIYGPNEIFEFQRLQHSLFNIQIAQKSVTKDIYFGASRPSFNSRSNFQNMIAAAAIVPNDQTTVGQSVFNFETPFILPPDLEFEIDLQIPAISALPAIGSWRLGLAIDGIGGIYDPGANL